MQGKIESIKTLYISDGAKIEEVITALDRSGINRRQAEASIEKLKEKNIIFEPTFDRLKIV